MAIYYGDGTNSEGGSTGGRIIQVTQNGFNSTSSANINAGSIWESTGLDVTLTPKDSTNKILIMASIHIAVTGPQNNQGIIVDSDLDTVDLSDTLNIYGLTVEGPDGKNIIVNDTAGEKNSNDTLSNAIEIRNVSIPALISTKIILAYQVLMYEIL